MSELIDEAYDFTPNTFRKYYHSNSKLYEKPQGNDFTFLLSESKKWLEMVPLHGRMLVELQKEYASTILDTDFKNNLRAKKSKIVKVGRNMKYDFWKPGMIVHHPHRIGMQLGFYDDPTIYRLLLEKHVLGYEVVS